ncbi:glycosyltransferase family 39 protein [Phytohabitans rumicis]|uniref:Glycosyltransferase RgtA/B/C/D-like domain-containing protein n=1 Tax=Phytohabitans rumicis TaxID=1076125 RepID=A0A6V8LLX5_9ACTN|nr:glycosyltransferase family 39 protein [Phytohabitans rumicis]GFJ95097.1 hypothetical protein Prum_087390 [Phytohabitans rumicis]
MSHTLKRAAPALFSALAMLVTGAVGLGHPALGWDENATHLVGQRSVEDILRQAGAMDGVITPYYLFMHCWTAVFGTSEIALRAPSLIAMAAGVGVAAELGRRLLDPAVGLVAGLILATLPPLSRYAQDARAYGFAFLLATLATLLFYEAVRRPGWWRWIGYAATVLLLGLAHILGLLVLAGHAWALATRWWHDRDRDRRLLRAVPATAVALLLVAPLVVLGLGQRGDQLDWMAPVTLGTVRAAPGSLAGSGTAALLLALAALLAVVRRPERRLVAELLVAVTVPPVLLLGVSFLLDPLWMPRYALFVLAPAALLAAAGLRTVRPPATPYLAGALLAALTLAALPAHRTLRGPAAHHGPDFRAAARVVADHQRAGDGIVYHPAGAGRSAPASTTTCRATPPRPTCY